MKTRSPSVIVIGGGFGGISAARTLQDASFQVCISPGNCILQLGFV